MTEVVKIAHTIQVSQQMLDSYSGTSMWDLIAEEERRTPEERAELARLALEARAKERHDAVYVPLSLSALIERMGWTAEYAEHLVQPYCGCGEGSDGWEVCRHADDLGISPY